MNVCVYSWEEKLQLAKTPVETTWLCHEIARCYVEIKRYDKAHDFADKGVQAADDARDPLWQMNTLALLAQCEMNAAPPDHTNAVEHLEHALRIAQSREDADAQKALEKALGLPTSVPLSPPLSPLPLSLPILPSHSSLLAHYFPSLLSTLYSLLSTLLEISRSWVRRNHYAFKRHFPFIFRIDY